MKTDVIENIGVITLARPWVHNAINRLTMEELSKALESWADDDEVKVVILTGEGDSFCSGGDVEELYSISREELREYFQEMKEVLFRLHHFPKPTVAAINGHALGGGCELASACDFRVSHPSAQLGFVHIALGITTGWGGTYYLLKALSRQAALELLLSGEKLDGTKAHRLGFVHKLFPAEDFLSHVLNWCKRFSRQPLETLLRYKQTVQEIESAHLPLEESLTREMERCLALWGNPMHHQAISRLLMKGRGR